MTACRTASGPRRSWTGVVLQPTTDVVERVGLTPADRHDEPVADEHHDLTGLDIAGALDVAQVLSTASRLPS
jgi:hypothetical protein